jgi:hypothetical protein
MFIPEEEEEEYDEEQEYKNMIEQNIKKNILGKNFFDKYPFSNYIVPFLTRRL